MDPGELADLNDAVVEDIDHEKEDAKQDDYMEPMDSHIYNPENWPELYATLEPNTTSSDGL
eukprot:5916684-Karenia_brevis.AAC.1